MHNTAMNNTIIVLLLIGFAYAIPQQRQRQTQQSQFGPDLDSKVQDIFGSPDQQRPVSGLVVTPDPFYTPTSSPQTLVIDDQNCTCVPYHMCDPRTNMVKTDPINSNEVTGFGNIDIRSDARDCEEALDVCCIGASTTEESIKPKPVETAPAGCGVRNIRGVDFQLIGAFDNEAQFGEFPWTVAIIYIENASCICAGSLIHPKAILTGAHCVVDYVQNVGDLKIRAGEWDTQTTKERLPYQERSVSRIFVHPNYRAQGLANDFAVVELENPFEMDEHINTVCLPPSYFVPNQQDCFASGWGKDVFGKTGKKSVIMKKVPLPIVDSQRCQSALQAVRLGPNFRLDPTFICAGGEIGKDTCQGDGGAPLVCPIDRSTDNRYIRYAQSGIVSWGLGCNDAVPGVYANVAKARGWIDEKIGFLGLDPSYYTFRN